MVGLLDVSSPQLSAIDSGIPLFSFSAEPDASRDWRKVPARGELSEIDSKLNECDLGGQELWSGLE